MKLTHTIKLTEFSRLDIEVDYTDDILSEIKVFAIDALKQVAVIIYNSEDNAANNMHEIADIVDNIDWSEIAADEKYNMKNPVCYE